MVDGDEGSVCKVKTQEAENFDEAGLGTSIIQRNSQATARYLFHPLGPKDSPRLWTILLTIGCPKEMLTFGILDFHFFMFQVFGICLAIA